METEDRINMGKDICRSLLSKYLKRHARIHDDAAYEDNARLRALSGICGDCNNLVLEFLEVNGKRRVVLRCLAGKSPLNLYLDNPIGEKVSCSKYEPKDKNG